MELLWLKRMNKSTESSMKPKLSFEKHLSEKILKSKGILEL